MFSRLRLAAGHARLCRFPPRSQPAVENVLQFARPKRLGQVIVHGGGQGHRSFALADIDAAQSPDAGSGRNRVTRAYPKIVCTFWLTNSMMPLWRVKIIPSSAVLMIKSSWPCSCKRSTSSRTAARECSRERRPARVASSTEFWPCSLHFPQQRCCQLCSSTTISTNPRKDWGTERCRRASADWHEKVRIQRAGPLLPIK